MIMKQYEKRIYSQNGEDGIIEHIFKQIGTTNKVAVEFGVSAGGGGMQTNTRLLAEQGWKTIWIDGAPLNHPPPGGVFVQKFLTSKNICSVFEEYNIPKELDLLSIDIDGNDYHLRESLSIYSPRVYIIEYNGSYDGNTKYVMPENDEYVWSNRETIFGASLLSLTDQANRLGYDLVYCDKNGVNAFYVRKDINIFPSKTSSEAWAPLYWAWGKKRIK
jgi:hypothetical protein